MIPDSALVLIYRFVGLLSSPAFLAALNEWWWLFLLVDGYWLIQASLVPWLLWRQSFFDAKMDWVLIEVRVPSEVLEPIKAMETVITGFWQIVSDPGWYEKWWKGEFLLSFVLEIVAIDGVPHFYIRLPGRIRQMFEAHIYSQYPQAEIFQVEDYTKNIPQDIPNDQWEMWGTEYKNLKPWAYPIKTYAEFETGKEIEEKRIDPISSLLEGMAKLKPGEQIWIQVRCTPILDDAKPLKKQAEKLRDKLARRESKEVKTNPMLQDAVNLLVFNKPLPGPPPPEEKEVIPVEMKLTPGEKEVLAGVERKLDKLWYMCSLKYVYLAKKDVFFGPNARVAMSYFTSFVSENSNGLVPDARTLTKVVQHWYDWFWFIKERLYLRKRRLFRVHLNRLWVVFPRPGHKGLEGSGQRFILDAEELASLYHFPGRLVAPAPTLQRVETKKGEPPPELPVE